MYVSQPLSNVTRVFFFPPKFYCRQRSTDRKQYETLGSTHRFRCKKKITRGERKCFHIFCVQAFAHPQRIFFFLVQSGHFPLESCVNRSLLFFFYLCNRPASSVIFKQFSCKNVGLLLSRFVKGGTDSSQRPLGKKNCRNGRLWWPTMASVPISGRLK